MVTGVAQSAALDLFTLADGTTKSAAWAPKRGSFASMGATNGAWAYAPALPLGVKTTPYAITLVDGPRGSCAVSYNAINCAPIGGLGGAFVGMMPSDLRLKKNVRKTGGRIGALDEYTWEWNSAAEALGVTSSRTVGVIAQEALAVYPDAVEFNNALGYYQVDYGKLAGLASPSLLA